MSLNINMNDKTCKILSFDVGIKNLAYCLIEKNGDDFSILNWGIINLAEDFQKCEFNMKGGTQCQQVAKYNILHKEQKLIFENTSSIFVCNKHKEKKIPHFIENIAIINNDEDDDKLKKKKKKEKEKEKEKEKNIPNCNHPSCNDKSQFILSSNNNIGLCNIHFTKQGKQFEKKIQAKKISLTNCNKQPMQLLSETLFQKLDEHDDFLNVDEVLIENQPSLKNPTMKTISSILYAYFVIRGKIDNIINNSKINLIKFVSPSNKLKIDKKITSKVLKNDEGVIGNTYKLTKSLGVKYCISIINEQDKILLNQYKKKDDLADSFLQGFQYLFSPVPQKYLENIKKVDIKKVDIKKD
jgi:hypothetical protein